MCLQRYINAFTGVEGSTWVEIHVCLQLVDVRLEREPGSTWVEIHVCLQLARVLFRTTLWSTWVEIHVCLQHAQIGSSGDSAIYMSRNSRVFTTTQQNSR